MKGEQVLRGASHLKRVNGDKLKVYIRDGSRAINFRLRYILYGQGLKKMEAYFLYVNDCV